MMTTDGGNKIIADYMGVVINGEPIRVMGVQVNTTKAHYHDSWDWIMPVWTKLLNDGIDNCLEGEVTSKKWDKMSKSEWHQICVQALMTGEIGLFWGGIVAGVEWMNEKNSREKETV